MSFNSWIKEKQHPTWEDFWVGQSTLDKCSFGGTIRQCIVREDISKIVNLLVTVSARRAEGSCGKFEEGGKCNEMTGCTAFWDQSPGNGG